MNPEIDFGELFNGGGCLFRSLAEARLVDTVEVVIIPLLLGEGIPLPPPPAERLQLTLASHKSIRPAVYP